MTDAPDVFSGVLLSGEGHGALALHITNAILSFSIIAGMLRVMYLKYQQEPITLEPAHVSACHPIATHEESGKNIQTNGVETSPNHVKISQRNKGLGTKKCK